MTTALSSAAAQFPFDIIPTLLQGLATLSTQYTQLMGQLINAIFGPTGATTYQNVFVTAANVTKFSTWANDAMSAPNLGMTEFKVFWQPRRRPRSPNRRWVPDLACGQGLARAWPTPHRRVWVRRTWWETCRYRPVGPQLPRRSG